MLRATIRCGVRRVVSAPIGILKHGSLQYELASIGGQFTVDALIDKIDRLAELPDAFDAENLSRIATWAMARSEDTFNNAAIGQLTVDGPSHDRPRTVRFPADYRPAPRQRFVTFRAALTALSSHRPKYDAPTVPTVSTSSARSSDTLRASQLVSEISKHP